MYKGKSEQTKGCCSNFEMENEMASIMEKMKSCDTNSCCKDETSSEEKPSMKKMMEMMQECMRGC